MKLYICGPVTGYSDLNLPTFEYAAEQLQEMGLEAVIPHSFVPPDARHNDAMRLCISRLCEGDIDGLVVLPGFTDSRGSRLEIDVADGLDIPVCPIDSLLDVAESMGRRADGRKTFEDFRNPVYVGVDMAKDESVYVFGSMNNGYMKEGDK